jgi:GT2 family glycosyltransferase/glycosyltransferase involved in cell wall biosynthesis
LPGPPGNHPDEPSPRPADELEAGLAELRARCDELAHEAAGLRRQVERAERMRRDVVAAVDNYHARLSSELKSFRGQRAWNVMLYLRKAYTILARPLLARRLPSPARVLSLLFQPGKKLDLYDIRFPDLKHALPRGLRYPFAIDLPQDVITTLDGRPAAGAGIAPQRKYDVVVFPVFDFDFRHQRPQHLATQFAEAGHRVFWVSPSRFCEDDKPYDAIAIHHGIWEVRLGTALPNIYQDVFRPKQVEAALECLSRLFRDFAVAESCAVVELPFWRALGVRLREVFHTRLVYDCMDDWQTMPDVSAFNRKEEPRLSADCDVLIATSRHLAERHRDAGRPAVLVRNGADFEHFATPAPRWFLDGVPRPIVGYFGAIADWFDYDLLCEVARARPQYSFVLVGGWQLEESLTHDEAKRLGELPNVHLLGHKPYDDIPSYLAEFDVCTIPFVLNDVTKATDPVKLYEYLSQGKPVVATPMGELRECGDLVYLAGTAEEFAAALDQAAAEPHDGELRRRRVEFASHQRWADRWRSMDEAIRGAFPLVSILLVAYNSAEYVDLCLESVLAHTSYPAFEVVAVDNASQDGTAERLEAFAARDARVRVLRNTENLGFAGGNNQAAAAARGEYLVFLNVDTVVTPGWVERLVRACARGRDVGLVGPVTNQIGNEAKIPVSYANAAEMERFATRLATERFGETLEMRVAALFCALMPRPVWERVGPLDEGFKVGMFEDDDLAFRVRAAGLRIVAAEDCFVHHFGQGSFAKLRPDFYEEVFAANRRRFEEKWNTEWIPHQYRPGVTAEEGRYDPAAFSVASSEARP